MLQDFHGRVGSALRWQHWACPLKSLQKRQWCSVNPTPLFYIGENRGLERGNTCQQQNLYSNFTKWSVWFLVVCPKQRLWRCSKQASKPLFPLSVLTGFLYLVFGLTHSTGITGIHCVFEPQLVRHCILSTFWKTVLQGIPTLTHSTDVKSETEKKKPWQNPDINEGTELRKMASWSRVLPLAHCVALRAFLNLLLSLLLQNGVMTGTTLKGCGKSY